MANFDVGGRKVKRLADAGIAAMLPQGTPVKLTPNSAADLAVPARGIWSGTAGTINFVGEDGEMATGFPIFPGYNPITVKRLLTGGTANDLWSI